MSASAIHTHYASNNINAVSSPVPASHNQEAQIHLTRGNTRSARLPVSLPLLYPLIPRVICLACVRASSDELFLLGTVSEMRCKQIELRDSRAAVRRAN